jgi:hypothetical protein
MDVARALARAATWPRLRHCENGFGAAHTRMPFFHADCIERNGK